VFEEVLLKRLNVSEISMHLLHSDRPNKDRGAHTGSVWLSEARQESQAISSRESPSWDTHSNTLPAPTTAPAEYKTVASHETITLLMRHIVGRSIIDWRYRSQLP
jgi:hypothetical protein